MKNINKKKLIFGTFIFLVLAVVYAPVLLLTVFSFSETDTMSIGQLQENGFQFGFGLYARLFSDFDIWKAVFVTVALSVIGPALATIIGTMACVSIQRMRRRTRGIVVGLSQFPFINAEIVTAFSLLLFFSTIGIINSDFLRLILAYTLFCLPVVVLVILPRLKSLDHNLFDAAMDLGAKPHQALIQVLIPQLLPAMFASFLVGFTLSINDFVITQYNSTDLHTISTIVFGSLRGRGIPPEFRALSALMFALVMGGLIIYNVRARKKSKQKNPLQ